MARWNIVFSFLSRLLERKKRTFAPAGDHIGIHWEKEREKERKKIRDGLGRETIRLHPYSYEKQNCCSRASVFSMLIHLSATPGWSDDREKSGSLCCSLYSSLASTVDYWIYAEERTEVSCSLLWSQFTTETDDFVTCPIRYVCEWYRQSPET